MGPSLPNRYVAILAPYPSQDRFMDGWMSRIRTIDLALNEFARVYIDFQEWFPETSEPEIVAQDDMVLAVRLSPTAPKHKAFVDQALRRASFVYIHTMHQCKYALDYFDADKMVVDIHGVVPEEEFMMGSLERSAKFAKIEKAVFSQLKNAFVVTKKMARHFAEKYPSSAAQLHHLPVYDFDAAEDTHAQLDTLFDQRNKQKLDQAIYAGGAQIWQCVDEMLDLMRLNQGLNEFLIFSHDEMLFSSLIRKHGLPADVFKGYTNKEKLKQAYQASNFGFVLRQDTTVNRVASPTKICDYCAAAVIPIVDFPGIGDFLEYGYAYVDAADYARGFIPDIGTQRWMAKNNLICMKRMEKEFSSGIDLLQTWVRDRLAN